MCKISFLQVARETYKTLKGGKESLDMAKMARGIAEEWKVLLLYLCHVADLFVPFKICALLCFEN